MFSLIRHLRLVCALFAVLALIAVPSWADKGGIPHNGGGQGRQGAPQAAPAPLPAPAPQVAPAPAAPVQAAPAAVAPAPKHAVKPVPPGQAKKAARRNIAPAPAPAAAPAPAPAPPPPAPAPRARSAARTPVVISARRSSVSGSSARARTGRHTAPAHARGAAVLAAAAASASRPVAARPALRTVAVASPAAAPRTAAAPAGHHRAQARQESTGGGSLHLPRLRDLVLPTSAQLADVHIPRGLWAALAALGLLAAVLAGVLAVYVRRLRRAAAHAEALAGLASTDPLTGLLNRRAIEDRLTVEVARARRYGGKLAVVYGDLRALKTINDRYGHDVGDRALRTVAGVLRSQIREGDAGARVGGDEYAISLVNQDREGAAAFCDRVRRRLGTTRTPAPAIPLDLTMGVAVFPDDGDTAADLLTAADRNLYAQRGISVAG